MGGDGVMEYPDTLEQGGINGKRDGIWNGSAEWNMIHDNGDLTDH